MAKTNKADMFTVTTASKKKSCESKEWSIFGVVAVDAWHLEVVGGEGDDVEKQGGHVHCEQVAQDPPSQGDLQFF